MYIMFICVGKWTRRIGYNYKLTAFWFGSSIAEADTDGDDSADDEHNDSGDDTVTAPAEDLERLVTEVDITGLASSGTVDATTCQGIFVVRLVARLGRRLQRIGYKLGLQIFHFEGVVHFERHEWHRLVVPHEVEPSEN